MNSVYFFEAFEEEEALLRKCMPSNINAGFTWKTIQESGHDLSPAPIISTRTQSIYPEHWADKLEAIISRSTGFEHLLAYRIKTNTPIKMGYLPLYCHRAVAEQAIMLTMALLRKLTLQTRQFNRFERDGLTGSELQHKNLVVYGIGNIGYELVKIGRGLDMKVFGVDIIKKHDSVKYVSPLEGAKLADVVICAMNLTEENKKYFNEDYFENVKASLIFINISRGEISPSAILLPILENRKIAGVALDVFDHEKSISVGLRSGKMGDSAEALAVQKMMVMENVILTPHNAFNTAESVERKCIQTIEQLIFFIENNKFKWQV